MGKIKELIDRVRPAINHEKDSSFLSHQEAWDLLLTALEEIDQRLNSIETKPPTYVPPPVYGPGLIKK